MPNPMTLSKKDAMTHFPQLPNIEDDGEFTFIKKVGDSNIYIFSFEDTVSCSDVGPVHAALPMPVDVNMITESELFERKSKLGAGSAYLHLNANAVESHYPAVGKYQVTYQDVTVILDNPDEEERTNILDRHLNSYISDHYKDMKVSRVAPVKKKKGHNFCRFTGGGDEKITKDRLSLLLMTHVNTEFGEGSPTKEYESRNVLDMELKVSVTKSDEDCELQLKANMYNLLVREFVSNVYSTSNLSDLENLSHYTVYGIFLA